METLVILGAVYLLTQERKPSANPQPTLPPGKTPAEEWSGIVKDWAEFVGGLVIVGSGKK